jgi:hypothetical protein
MKLIDHLREIIQTFTNGKQKAPVSPEYSYRIFWTSQALDWTVEKREQIKKEVRLIIQQDDFEANQYARRYKLEAFGGQKHAGVSILVLNNVLSDLKRIQGAGGFE